MLRQDQFIKGQIALAAWRHGHHYGGVNSMLMIACVLANRHRTAQGTWLDVIESIPARSALLLSEQPEGYPDMQDPSFIKLLEAVDKIYDGTFADMTEGKIQDGYGMRTVPGLYWADLGKITNKWFLEKIARDPANHPRLANSGTLYFWG